MTLQVDGVDVVTTLSDLDTLGELSCAADEIAKWSGSVWQCATDDGVPYSRTFLVGPVGTWTENGAALLAAMAAIPDRTGSADIALLKIEPGWYDLGGEQLVIKPYVDIEGAGHSNYQTLIRTERCGDNLNNLGSAAVVVGGQFTEVRDVVIQNTCADTSLYAVAYFNEGMSAKLRRVHAYIQNSMTVNPYGAWAIYNTANSFELADVKAVAFGDSLARCIYNTGDDAVFRRVEVTSQSSGGFHAQGIETFGDRLQLIDVDVEAGGALSTAGILGSATGATLRNVTVNVWGGLTPPAISLQDPQDLVLDSVIAKGGATGIALHVNPDAPAVAHKVTLTNVTAEGTGRGFRTSASVGTVDAVVRGSTIHGATNSIEASNSSIGVGGSQVSGGPISGSGCTCAGVWDEAFVFYPSTCP